MRIPTRLGDFDVRLHGTGDVAVLWHSLYVDDRMWDDMAHLLARDRRLVRITGPGHGLGIAPYRRYSLAACAAAALAILDALEHTGPVDWIGCAWGGHVGLELAAARPSRIRSLVSFNAPVARLTAAERRTSRLLALALRTVGPIPPVVGGVTRALLSDDTRAARPDSEAYIAECLTETDRHALADATVAVSLHRPDLTEALEAVECPALLVTGDSDPMWTPEQADAAAERMPHATAAVVPHTRHLTPFEAPTRSAHLVRDLWAQASATAAA